MSGRPSTSPLNQRGSSSSLGSSDFSSLNTNATKFIPTTARTSVNSFTPLTHNSSRPRYPDEPTLSTNTPISSFHHINTATLKPFTPTTLSTVRLTTSVPVTNAAAAATIPIHASNSSYQQTSINHPNPRFSAPSPHIHYQQNFQHHHNNDNHPNSNHSSHDHYKSPNTRPIRPFNNHSSSYTVTDSSSSQIRDNNSLPSQYTQPHPPEEHTFIISKTVQSQHIPSSKPENGNETDELDVSDLKNRRIGHWETAKKANTHTTILDKMFPDLTKDGFIFLSSVIPESPAALYGLQSGDIILAISKYKEHTRSTNLTPEMLTSLRNLYRSTKSTTDSSGNHMIDYYDQAAFVDSQCDLNHISQFISQYPDQPLYFLVLRQEVPEFEFEGFDGMDDPYTRSLPPHFTPTDPQEPHFLPKSLFPPNIPLPPTLNTRRVLSDGTVIEYDVEFCLVDENGESQDITQLYTTDPQNQQYEYKFIEFEEFCGVQDSINLFHPPSSHGSDFSGHQASLDDDIALTPIEINLGTDTAAHDRSAFPLSTPHQPDIPNIPGKVASSGNSSHSLNPNSPLSISKHPQLNDSLYYPYESCQLDGVSRPPSIISTSSTISSISTLIASNVTSPATPLSAQIPPPGELRTVPLPVFEDKDAFAATIPQVHRPIFFTSTTVAPVRRWVEVNIGRSFSTAYTNSSCGNGTLGAVIAQFPPDLTTLQMLVHNTNYNHMNFTQTNEELNVDREYNGYDEYLPSNDPYSIDKVCNLDSDIFSASSLSMQNKDLHPSHSHQHHEQQQQQQQRQLHNLQQYNPTNSAEQQFQYTKNNLNLQHQQPPFEQHQIQPQHYQHQQYQLQQQYQQHMERSHSTHHDQYQSYYQQQPQPQQIQQINQSHFNTNQQNSCHQTKNQQQQHTMLSQQSQNQHSQFMNNHK